MAATKGLAKLRQTLLGYTNWMVLPSESILDLPAQEKLIICQITPEKALREWPIKNKNWDPILYVPIWYVERCLNFVSKFKRWLKVQREWMDKYTRMVKKRVNGSKVEVETEVFDAWVLADFYIELDWHRIERSCYWSRIMYANPATSNFNVYEAARSMATKSFADTLWIASDRLSKEFDNLREEREAEQTIDMSKVVEWFSNVNDSANGKLWTADGEG